MNGTKLIFKRDHLDNIPDRWRRQYGSGYYLGDENKQDIQRKLDALPRGKFMAEDADLAIGNNSWTKFECDLCGNDKDVLLRMGEPPDYEARWLDVCQECLSAALRKF